mgnify:CR=1 FL=1
MSDKKKPFLSIFKKRNEENEENKEYDLKKLHDLKEKVKNVRTIEELESLEDELVELGLISPGEIKKLKNRKKGRVEAEYFQARVRVSMDIINRTIEVGKQFKERNQDAQKIAKEIEDRKQFPDRNDRGF